VRALVVFFAVTFLYPQFLTLKIGSVDFNTARIVILVFYMRLILRTRLLQEMRWTLLDKMVMFVFFTTVISRMFNNPFMHVIESRGGSFVSVFLPYIAIRAIVRTKEDFRGLVQGLVLIGLVLAVLGGYQSLTGHNPMGFMKSFNAWDPSEQRLLSRFGLYRADVSFGQYIVFGLYFTIVLPLALVLHKRETNPLKTMAFIMILSAGVVSSMSSAPIFAFVACAALILFYPFRRYTFALFGLLLATAAFMEFYSEQHFYEVFTKFALNSKTAAYRIGLINEALGGGMNGHWLVGFGDVGIGTGTDNTHFHWEHQDLVNVYVSHLVRGGLMALIPFTLMNLVFYRCLWVSWRTSLTFEDRWMVWCLSTSLIGLNMALMTISTTSHLKLLLYILVAFAGCMPRLVGEEVKEEVVRTPKATLLVPLHDGGVRRGGVNRDRMIDVPASMSIRVPRT